MEYDTDEDIKCEIEDSSDDEAGLVVKSAPSFVKSAPLPHQKVVKSAPFFTIT